MNLKIQKLNNTILNQALAYFSHDFIEWLKSKTTFNESLVARYLIEQNDNKYNSISHKKDLVFIWTNDRQIWVDIEIVKKRDTNLLDKFTEKEYEILWEKKWKNFYILWTAKESIIKLENLVLDDMWKIELIKKEKLNKYLSKINFNNKLICKYEWKEFNVLNWFDKDMCYSISNY